MAECLLYQPDVHPTAPFSHPHPLHPPATTPYAKQQCKTPQVLMFMEKSQSRYSIEHSVVTYIKWPDVSGFLIYPF
jgi:hypothetical protein